MKKTWVLLLVLTLVALSVPVFADAPVVKGNFVWFGDFDFSTDPIGIASVPTKARLKIDTMVDKNNEVYIELRGEGNVATWGASEFKVKNFKFSSDLLKTLGLEVPVSVKLTGGYWDTYFTNWWYNDSTGWVFYYGGAGNGANWANKLVNYGENVNGAFQLDIGALEGKVNVHYYSDTLFTKAALGVDAAFSGFGVYLAYGMPTADFATGTVSVEAKYDVPEFAGFKINVAPFFRYALSDDTYTWGASVGAGYKMFSLAAALNGDSVSTIDHWSVEAAVKPTDAAKIGVVVLGQPSGLAGVDVNASYAIGPLTMMAGYLFAVDATTGYFPVFGDLQGFANDGLYVGASISF
jgi:hypothetical protein